MALSASAVCLFSSGVRCHNYSPGRKLRERYDVCGFGVSPRILIGSRSGRLAIQGTLLGGRRRRDSLFVVAAENSNSNPSGEPGATSSEADVKALEARLGLGRRARRQQTASDSPESKPAPEKPKAPKKTWDSMNIAEKAWALYIDPEKGILFWLNKLAYGAIYTIIGAWIVFRFIGPALGWYQLDQPLLTPDRLLDGGP